MSTGVSTLAGTEGKQNEMAQQIPMVQFECVNCKNVMSARQPMPQIYNFPSVSGIVFPHERVARCPHCGLAYVPQVRGLGPSAEIQIGWMAIERNLAPAIAPPTQRDIDAVNQSKLIQP